MKKRTPETRTIAPVETVTLDDVRRVLDDKDYLAEDREMIREVLAENNPHEIERLRRGVWLGERFEEMEVILSGKGPKQPHQDYTRKLLREIARQVEKNRTEREDPACQIIIDEVTPELMRRYFDQLSDDYGKKPYINPYTEVKDPLKTLVEYEVLSSIEAQEVFLIQKLQIKRI